MSEVHFEVSLLLPCAHPEEEGAAIRVREAGLAHGSCSEWAAACARGEQLPS